MNSLHTQYVATAPLPVGVIASLIETVCVRDVGYDDMIGMPNLGSSFRDGDNVTKLDIEGISESVCELDWV